jgi:hypothetical protein
MFSLAFRTRRYGIEYEYEYHFIEYEYHFIEYEYDKSQYSATSKANGEGLNPVHLRVGCSDLHRRALDRDRQSGCLTKLSQ